MSLLTPEQQAQAKDAEAFEPGKFEALPAGRYACRLVQLEPHTTGTSFAVRWKIAKGQKYAGRTFIDFPSNKPEYLGKIKTILYAVGGTLASDPSDVMYSPAWVNVTEEFDNRPEHKGEKQNKVKFVEKYDGPPLPEEDDQFSDDDIPFGSAPGDDDAEGLI
jgi:hypothetical protein